MIPNIPIILPQLNTIMQFLDTIVKWVTDITHSINQTVDEIQRWLTMFTNAFNSLFAVPFVNTYTMIGLNFLNIIVSVFLTVFAVKVVQRFL